MCFFISGHENDLLFETSHIYYFSRKCGRTHATEWLTILDIVWNYKKPIHNQLGFAINFAKKLQNSLQLHFDSVYLMLQFYMKLFVGLRIVKNQSANFLAL